MTRAQMIEIELHRQIHNFQEAVTAFTLNGTLENAHRLAIAKNNLSNFMIGEKL